MRIICFLLFLHAITPSFSQTRYLRAIEQNSENKWQFISFNVNTEEKTLLTILPDTLAPWGNASTFDQSLQRYYYIAKTPENIRKLVTLNAFSGDIIGVIDCPGVNVISAGMNGQLYGFQYISSTSAVRINPFTGQFTPLFDISSYFFGFSTNASVAHPTQPYFLVNGTPPSAQGNRLLVYNTAQNLAPSTYNQGNGSLRILRGHAGNGNFYGIRFFMNPTHLELVKQDASRLDSIIVINDSLSISDADFGQGTLLSATNELFHFANPKQGEDKRLMVFNLQNGEIVKTFDPSVSFQLFEATIFAPDFASNRLSGTVFLDDDQNGIQNVGELGLGNEFIRVEPGGYQLYSGPSGHFSIPLPSGEYTVNIHPSSHFELSSAPAEFAVPFPGTGLERTNLNFGLKIKASIEEPESLSVKISCYRLIIGHTSEQIITVRNSGSKKASGKLTYHCGERVLINESSPTPTTVNGNEYTFDLIDLVPGEIRTISIQLEVPPNTDLIDEENTSTVHLETETNSGETLIEQDWCGGLIRGSLDPNDKLVNGASSSEIIPSDTLRYLIRFQNVGNDTAYRVVIRDTLPPDLIRETFRILASSHDYTVYLKGNELVWEFDNILLPDSATNQEGSNGFVDFEMVCTGNMMKGHSFSNTAAIYFDYNPPVITNAAIASYPLGIFVPEASSEIRMYPNPANENVTLQFLKQQTEFTVLTLSDIYGKEWLHIPVKPMTRQLTIPLGRLAPGVYIFSLRNSKNGAYSTGRLILNR